MSRIPSTIPEDPEAEACLLATLALEGNEHKASMELAKLCPEDFLNPSHRAVFTALKANIACGQESSPFTLKARMEQQGTLTKCGGFPWLMELLGTGEVTRPEAFVEILHNKRRRRQLMKLGAQITDKAASDEVSPEELISQAQSDLKTIGESGRSVRSTSAIEIMHKMASFEPLRSGSRGEGGYWGIPTLDDYAPIPTGEYTVIGARPGVGKTTMMAQVACTSAKRGLNVLIVTLEVPKEDLEARIAAHLSYAGLKSVKDGNYSAEQVNAIGSQAGTLERLRYLDPNAGTPWSTLEANIRYEIDRHKIGLVLVDQFDKIGRPVVAKGSSEAYAFGKVSEGIMGMVKECRIGFVLLCQLKADAEGREPDLSSHADSDRPGKDGALVVHLWRKDDKTKAKIQKNRNGGGVGYVVNLNFDGSHQRLTEMERETEPVKVEKRRGLTA